MPGVYITKIRKRRARIQKTKDLLLSIYLAAVLTGWLWTFVEQPVL